MKTYLAICIGLLSILTNSSPACESPSDDSYYLTTMQDERDLTLQALAKSDLVLVGTVTGISHGNKTSYPGDRVSEVQVEIAQVLLGPPSTPSPVSLAAKLHHVILPCFGNESFWDDQVEQGGEYIFFISSGKILSASAAARSWRKLGLHGQREIVLSSVRNGR